MALNEPLLAVCAFVCALQLLAPSTATALPVDVELVLAVDVSRSIDDDEAKLQRDGYMAALTHPRVIRAIQSGPLGGIAVAYVEWAGAQYQRTMVNWTLIRDADSAAELVARIAATPRVSMNWTSISGAIDYAVGLFDDNGFEGSRMVIDVSGDGRNNSGRPASAARDAAVAKGIIINGLPVMNNNMNFGRPAEADLDLYYEQNVIGGEGAFMIVARDFNAFPEAVLSKLIMEIAGVTPASAPQLADRPGNAR